MLFAVLVVRRTLSLVPRSVALWEHPAAVVARVNAAFAAFGGASLLAIAVTAPGDVSHLGLVVAAQVCWLASAAAEVLVVRRDRSHAVDAAMLALSAALCIFTVWASGGPHTPVGSMAQAYVVLVIVAAASELTVGPMLAFAVVCTLSRLLPLAYGGLTAAEALSSLLAGTLIAAAAGVLVIAARVSVGRIAQTSAALYARDAALRELATLVATDRPIDEVMSFAAGMITDVGVADCAVVLAARSGRAHAMACASVNGDLHAGCDFAIAPGSPVARVLSTGEMVAFAPANSRMAMLGYETTSLAPILVHGRVWGALTASLRPEREQPDELQFSLKACAELVGVAIGNAEHSEILRQQATTDALTELLNHRVLHDRIVEEVAWARRHGRALSVAVLDIDHFKQVNDTMGHVHGDSLLRTVAHVLRDMSRTEDAIGRIGGDEFAVLMPETDERDALRALERVRRRIAADTGQTISVGVCGVEHAGDVDGLLRRADCALYWSKANGRDLGSVFEPEVMEDPSADDRARALARSQALAGLRALAAAIDAKDASTQQHAERVARLSAQLAERLGWSPERVALVHEAGLVHDVGKIGVPDAVLFKPDRLGVDEFEQIKAHAALGAQIVESVLTLEQVSWVRSHHERPDGGGYPDGLDAESLPDGAAIITVADAFDAMTTARPYGEPRTPAEALAECETLTGRQFLAAPVSALASIVHEQDDEPVGLSRPAPAGAPTA